MKEAYVLIKIKPKDVEEFCLKMVACKERCNRAPESRNFAKIEDVFSVFGHFDFLLELSSKGGDETKNNEKIYKTIFKIRETLGNYIDETCTLTKFDLSECLENNSKYLLENAKSFETINIKNCKLDVFREFLNKEGAFDKLKDMPTELRCSTDERKELWTKNKLLFKLDGKYEECLKNGSVDAKLKNKFNEQKKFLSDKAKLFYIDEKNWKLIDELNRYGIYADTELKVYRIITKDVHVLIRVKPLYTEEFFIAMTVFKSLCNRSEDLAIIDEVFPILGPFDFILELSAVGKIEEKETKINKTILKIRETLGGYINETLTIKKFKVPLTNEELEELLKKITGEKNLEKLPGKNGEKIPDNSSNSPCDLIEICNADTTSLKNLLKKAKTSELENVKKQIDELTNRIKELENKR